MSREVDWILSSVLRVVVAITPRRLLGSLSWHVVQFVRQWQDSAPELRTREMAIRFAQVEDVPALVAIGQRMHALTRFRSLDYKPAKVAQALTDVITKGKHKYVFFVATGAEGKLVGGLIGVLEQHLFSDQLTASVMHFDVLPEARMGGHGVRLLKAFEAWCANRKVVEIAFGINSGEHLEALGRFAGRMGYVKSGENFIKCGATSAAVQGRP